MKENEGSPVYISKRTINLTEHERNQVPQMRNRNHRQ